MNFDSLKQKHRDLRDDFPNSLNLRVHRALSWLNKAEQCEDGDSQFVFLWIGFNSAYSQVLESSKFSEVEQFQQFVLKLCNLDKEEHIHNLLWNEFPNSIRMLINNKYVFQPFWDYHNGQLTEQEWLDSYNGAKRRANSALSQNDSPVLLSIVLARLYTLRNQLVHGGATWNSSANREQIRDGVKFLSKLLPALIDIMLSSPNELWGEAHYPVVD